MASFKIYNVQISGGETTVEIPVVFPGMTSTGETLTIRSVYSSAFREAQANMARQIQVLRMATKGEPLDEATLDELERSAFASLVSAWSFEEACTAANVVEFLQANPHMKDLISVQSAKDSLFFKNNDKK